MLVKHGYFPISTPVTRTLSHTSFLVFQWVVATEV
ncbi:Uncharacterised protein [Vibrio cholerae]|nr:Uncharacterised protein [Vibrio cholerae]CSH98113.1 Uncharacterised protein [Vibrio cholerae]CSI28896.1 Uncharacterised protein [Vibrio cholerae]